MFNIFEKLSAEPVETCVGLQRQRLRRQIYVQTLLCLHVTAKLCNKYMESLLCQCDGLQSVRGHCWNIVLKIVGNYTPTFACC